MAKWAFKEKGEIGNYPVGQRTRDFVLTQAGWPSWKVVSVWWDEHRRRAYCTECSSTLVAMSSSCIHAKALRRHMDRAEPPTKAPER